MQRGSPTSSPNTTYPSAQQQQQQTPPYKRQRLSAGSSATSTPTGPQTPQTHDDDDTLRHKSDATVPAHLRNADDTRWYLSVQEPSTDGAPAAAPALKIVSAGYGTLDARDDARVQEHDHTSSSSEEARPQLVGRTSFGKFKQSGVGAGTKEENDSDDDSSDEDGDGDDDEDLSDDPTGAKALIAEGKREAAAKARAVRKAKRKEERAEAARVAEERRRRTVNLNRLSGISAANSGGGGGGGGAAKAKAMVCHQCGKKGHARRDCSSGGGERGRARGRD